MQPIKTAFTILLLSLVSACGSSLNASRDNPAPKPTESLAAKPTDKPNQKPEDPELQKQIAEIAATAKGHVGVAAEVIESGESVSLNLHGHFPMQSVYKLPIGMAVMKLIEAGKTQLDEKVRVTKSDFVRLGQHSPIRDQNPNGAELSVGELLRFSISESDGTASDVLLKLAGGPESIAAWLAELKISEMSILNSEKEIGRDWQTQYRNWSSPAAAVALLRALHERRGLSKDSQAFLLQILIASTPGPKRLKGLLPARTIVAHKTGTSGTQKGITAATNDIGLISLPNGRHVAIAVFVSDCPLDEAGREAVIAKIAKVVWDKWSE